MISGTETRKESSQTRKGRTRERKNDLANAQREKDRAVDHDLAFTPIVIFASAVRSRPSSNPVTSLSSFFSQFDRIWWFFFSGFCLFLLLFQTPENIFQNFFLNATKHMKTFSFPENSISRKWNIFRKCFYTNQTQHKLPKTYSIWICKFKKISTYE